MKGSVKMIEIYLGILLALISFYTFIGTITFLILIWNERHDLNVPSIIFCILISPIAGILWLPHYLN